MCKYSCLGRLIDKDVSSGLRLNSRSSYDVQEDELDVQTDISGEETIMNGLRDGNTIPSERKA